MNIQRFYFISREFTNYFKKIFEWNQYNHFKCIQ